MFNFYEKISKLKNVERKGWKIRDVKNPENNRVESDAEHTFSMCMLAIKIMNAENLKLNQEKVLKMCLYHDLCEIEAGDTTPFDNLTKQAKYDKEIESIISVSYVADMPEILNLWKEFEEYLGAKGKLKKFRSEAVRVGFSKLWKDKNYKAIVDIANRLPEQTIQEDSTLLMYYDISLSRV